jgi:hypothetical protein
MRWLLGCAALLAVAALALGALGTRTQPGASAFDDGGRSGVGGAVSYRAQVIAPGRGDAAVLRRAFADAHAGTAARAPRALHEAAHRGTLWAIATFTLDDGRAVTERFSWRHGDGWLDHGRTPPLCPEVPREVRAAWHLTACAAGPR